jgi:hypothetical protein
LDQCKLTPYSDLYVSILQAHPSIPQEEKGAVCKYLNCQKLSQEACIDAVQNELMPLRLIVQALFVQQLSTHQAFRDCSDSFRYAHCGEFSGSLSSSRYPNSKSQNLGESPYTEGAQPGRRPLSFLLQKDISPEFSRNEYESTSLRIQNLEQELMSLKRSLQLQSISKTTEPISTKKQSMLKPYGMESRSLSKKKKPSRTSDRLHWFSEFCFTKEVCWSNTEDLPLDDLVWK